MIHSLRRFLDGRLTECFAFSIAMKSKRKTIWLFGCVFAVYVGSYLALSRRGYAEADRFDTAGFYYFPPEDSRAWRVENYGAAVLFWPLNAVDRMLGCGREISSEPMMSGFSK